MIDIQLIRDNPKLVKEKSAKKGFEVDIDKLLELDRERLELLQTVEALRAKRNENAEKIKKAGKPDSELVNEGKRIKIELAEKEKYLSETEQEWTELLKSVPNMPLDDVPVGASEKENVVTKTVGEPPNFDFRPKTHHELGEALGWIDKERAAKVAGSRFAYLKGAIIRIHFALIRFGLGVLTNEDLLKNIAKNNNLNVSNKGFMAVLPPLMIKTDMYDAMDRLEPRDDRYKIENEDLWLQGSAEHVLGSMHADEIISEEELPIRYAGYATSFRREAGSYGKDTEGIIRMHQFEKLEMQSLTTAETSLEEHKFMIAIQEYLMQQLGLPYRVLNKCTADIGKPNARGVDIDAWLPSQDKYRETHTADYMTDYQARRLNTRVKRASGEIELVHTNDATVFSQRPLIAIMENFQQADGSIKVPKVLEPYM